MKSAEKFFRNAYIQYLLLITVSYFIVFFKLGSFPFRLWDESMFAVNAYEMAENGNYMVPYADHAVDWRNSKPLLLTWIQVGLIKTFGFSELTMRLPSALAVMGSVLLLFTFLRHHFNTLFAWLAILILLTSPGYITFHTGRSGDADALLSFLILGTILSWANWLLENRSADLVMSCTFFALALLTKSFAALVFAPVLIAITLFYLKQKTISLFRSGGFYFGLVIISVALFVTFYVRELYQPGYLEHTFNNDAGRFGSELGGHGQGWDFYLEHIFYNRFSYWGVFFFIGLFIGFTLKKSADKWLFWIAAGIVFGYLLLISFSITKLVWYDMPVYPVMSAIAAIPVYLLVRYISRKRPAFFNLAVIVIIFFIPYRQQFFKSQSNAFSPGDRTEEITSIFLFNQIRSDHASDMTIYHYGYNGSVLCYKYLYADRGFTLNIKYTPDFVSGEKVFVGNDSLKSVLHEKYAVDTLQYDTPGLLVRIR